MKNKKHLFYYEDDVLLNYDTVSSVFIPEMLVWLDRMSLQEPTKIFSVILLWDDSRWYKLAYGYIRWELICNDDVPITASFIGSL